MLAAIMEKSNWNELLELYSTWLKGQSLSRHTQRAYFSRVKHFAYSLAPRISVEAFLMDREQRSNCLLHYSQTLKDVQTASRSINNILTGIANFLTFLEVDADPVLRERNQIERPRVLNEDELRAYLQVVSAAPSRDRALVSLLLNTGIRLSECTDLNVDDLQIDEDTAAIRVNARTEGRTRTIPLNWSAKCAIAEWLLTREQSVSADQPALFASAKGLRLSHAGVDLIVRKLGWKATLQVSAAILRNTCLSQLAAADINLVAVANLAGHKCLDSTKRYMAANNSDQVLIMESLVQIL